MASMREIRRRRDSIRSTEQITRAMKLVSTAKLQKARERLEKTRRYADVMERTVRPLLASAEGNGPSPGKKAVIVITSNRGLAGGYNNSVVRLVTGQAGFTAQNTLIYAVGKKGRDAFAGKNYEIAAEFTSLAEQPEYEHVAEMAEELLERAASGGINEIYLAYTEFKNMVVQKPVLRRILPEPAGVQPEEEGAGRALMEYEPSREDVLAALIPQYVGSLIYMALLEAAASEHGARMNAMESAAQNAEEMIEELDLKYNRARQGSITQELTEIISGAGAI